eukprot:2613006-Alexandrium_andersonii.AAC.1
MAPGKAAVGRDLRCRRWTRRPYTRHRRHWQTGGARLVGPAARIILMLARAWEAVSYTHLTLPTICSV